MNTAIQQEAAQRQISRLCHFTRAKSLSHIATNQTGVLATRYLKADPEAVLSTTDARRLDRRDDHVCTSVEYPNSYYLRKAQKEELIFPDWVILFLRPDYLWQEATLFSPRNAAAAGGSLLQAGLEGFRSLYAPSIEGAYGKTRTRGLRHLLPCPTDIQAEVLVPHRIQFRDIVAVAVRNETQAKNETSRLGLAGVPVRSYQFVIAPDLFDADHLASAIQAGKRPVETPWRPGSPTSTDPS